MSTKEDFTLQARIREDLGKGASRRLRHQELIPAIIYGGSTTPQSITLENKELIKHLEHEAFYSHIIQLHVDGKKEDVILKDLQRHPAKSSVMHADFLRVSKDHKLTTKVPLHFINEATAKGVKLQGGIISHLLTELEISCFPADLPEFIEVDMADVELGQIVHISDLAMPKGVESTELSHGEDHDLPVASINKPKGASEESEDDQSAEEESTD